MRMLQIRRGAFRAETVVCILLVLLVIANWVSLVNLLQTTSAERVVFWFMRQHLQLGEDPKFVLAIAGNGIPQPLEIIVRWPEFLIATAFSVFLIAGLLWLTMRVSRKEHQL